jgi:PhzF family phenazine biosynthesis protein
MQGRLHQIQTFTDHRFGGNPAYVVELPEWPGDGLLTALATELNLGVAAFLVASDDGHHLRFFSEQGRHRGAGHATLAAAWALFDRAAPGDAVTLRGDDGKALAIERDAGWIAITYAAVAMERRALPAALEQGLGQRPLEVWYAPFGHVAVLADEAAIAGLAPDLAALATLEGSTVIATAPGDEVDFVSRVFAPKLGLPEDPVCGTAHRQLTPYWCRRLGRGALVARHLSRRGGVLRCAVRPDGVAIAGRCVRFIDGTVDLD